jgi:hypothetical protein
MAYPRLFFRVTQILAKILNTKLAEDMIWHKSKTQARFLLRSVDVLFALR